MCTTSAAAPGDIGYEGPSYAETSDPTSQKRAESVLWWNDGSWWGVLWDAESLGFHVFKFDALAQTWSDTGVVLDTRTKTRPDVLWDGTHLYVASHKAGAPAPRYPSYLYRLSYNATSKTYTLDRGFPVKINDQRTETLVIAKDSTGKLWATWMQDNKIYVNRTNGDDASWG
ncbi:MAG: hypothetical protein M3310_03520, partial [Actinomycetota bacterium]|nr:hypothetical protein [Actinomycetota bacterium]